MSSLKETQESKLSTSLRQIGNFGSDTCDTKELDEFVSDRRPTLDGIWIGQDQCRMPLAPLSEYPEPWF